MRRETETRHRDPCPILEVRKLRLRGQEEGGIGKETKLLLVCCALGLSVGSRTQGLLFGPLPKPTSIETLPGGAGRSGERIATGLSKEHSLSGSCVPSTVQGTDMNYQFLLHHSSVKR